MYDYVLPQSCVSKQWTGDFSCAVILCLVTQCTMRGIFHKSDSRVVVTSRVAYITASHLSFLLPSLSICRFIYARIPILSRKPFSLPTYHNTFRIRVFCSRRYSSCTIVASKTSWINFPRVRYYGHIRVRSLSGRLFLHRRAVELLQEI